MGRLAPLALFAFVAVPMASCSAVLGLDPPLLDPCADAPCTDASVDATALRDAGSSEAAADAARVDAADAGPIVGVRCGGGAFPEVGCTDSTPLCCQTTTDAGVTSYACVDSVGACVGYAITCASNDDCAGSEVCCHFTSSTKCEGATTCANASLVCEPGGAADQCPTGWSCKGSVSDDGVDAPYFTCAQ